MPLGTLGKYERLDVLGHGVSGIVYLAKDTLLNKQVALKEVDVQAGDMRRFLEEARVMDRLRHPNIVRVNNVDRIDGKVVIDMEYVRGANLQDTLRTEGVFSIDRAADIAAQILDALDYAHSMQTVHRDIKPANILLSRDGQVKLVDFGLAEILTTNAYAGGAGTYAYMAPEDFAEEDHSDSQSDIWAVGITLFEMLTLYKPFQVGRVKDPFAWKRALENELPAPLSDYLPAAPAALQSILDQALEKDKRRRYATAGAFRDDLLRFRRGESVSGITQAHETAVIDRRLHDSNGANGNGGAAVNGTSERGPHNANSTAAYGLYDLTDSNERKEAAPAASNLVSEYDFSGGLFRNAAPAPSAVPPNDEPAGSKPTPAEAEVPSKSAAEQSAPGVVVAEVSPAANVKKNGANSAASRMRESLTRRRPVAERLTVEPVAVDFGAVRKGDLRTAKLKVRVENAQGSIVGSVSRKPEWLTAHPMSFERSRQMLTLTAHSGRTWETGDFEDSITIQTEHGTVSVPLFVRVLKPRPRFLHIAWWYVPLYVGAALPALTAATGGGSHALSSAAASLAASATAASGLLAFMLLLITLAADLGLMERFACGLLTALMAFAFGLAETHPTAHNSESTQRLFLTGGLVGLTLILQGLYLRRWKVWGVALLALSLLISFGLYHALGG